MAEISTSMGEQKEILRAWDTDLPLLSAKAAIELERYANGASVELSSVRRLAELIKNSIQREPNTAPRSLMDPSTIVVFGSAISRTRTWPETITMNDLLQEALRIASTLSDPSKDLHNEEITQTRDFCIALSRCASSYRHSMFGYRPKHPYRR